MIIGIALRSLIGHGLREMVERWLMGTLTISKLLKIYIMLMIIDSYC